mgnify:CR=1 FL=1
MLSNDGQSTASSSHGNGQWWQRRANPTWQETLAVTGDSKQLTVDTITLTLWLWQQLHLFLSGSASPVTCSKLVMQRHLSPVTCSKLVMQHHLSPVTCWKLVMQCHLLHSTSPVKLQTGGVGGHSGLPARTCGHHRRKLPGPAKPKNLGWTWMIGLVESTCHIVRVHPRNK